MKWWIRECLDWVEVDGGVRSKTWKVTNAEAEVARAIVFPVAQGSETSHVVQWTTLLLICCWYKLLYNAVPKQNGWATSQREGGLINPCQESKWAWEAIWIPFPQFDNIRVWHQVEAAMKASVLRILSLTSSVSKLSKSFVVPLYLVNNGVCHLTAHIVDYWMIKQFFFGLTSHLIPYYANVLFIDSQWRLSGTPQGRKI